MGSFDVIRARAERRKGGAQALAALLPPPPAREAVAALADDRVLAEMARRVFCTGFSWSVIEAKWPGFEEAFLGFEPAALAFQPDEFWEERLRDTRIVRHPGKIASVRGNALFVRDVASAHGSFGRFLAGWPATDQVGLMAALAKSGSRLGGRTGQMLLRFLGWDAFVLSQDVVACLRDAGLAIADPPSSRRDLAAVQARFNAWASETGLPLVHLSRICALSIGENHPPEESAARAEAES
ncbi:MAG: DNA-3-methyladenine glycosylase I [Alsobacter sp.]